MQGQYDSVAQRFYYLLRTVLLDKKECVQIGKCVTHIYHMHIYNKVREPNGSLLFHVKQKSMNLPVVSCKMAKYLMFHVKQL